MLGALGVAYNDSSVDFQGPYPTSYTLNKASKTLTVEFDHGRSPIEVRNNEGFQVINVGNKPVT